MNRGSTTKAAVMAAGGLALLVSGGTTADVINPGTYLLHNHPNGNSSPPPYGLKLDELFDVTGGRDSFTFDFDAAGAEVLMDFDGTSIHIYGTAFGGLDVGGDYDPNWTSFVEIDFTYQVAVPVPGDDDVFVEPSREGLDTGTVTWLDTNQTFDLASKNSDVKDFTFRLGDEDDNAGHRAFDGISGWGWLTIDGQSLIGQQDFLFTAELIPAPSAAVALLAGLGLGRRRRRTA